MMRVRRGKRSGTCSVEPRAPLSGIAAEFRSMFHSVQGYPTDVLNDKVVIDFEFAAIVVDIAPDVLTFRAVDIEGKPVAARKTVSVKQARANLAADMLYRRCCAMLDKFHIRSQLAAHTSTFPSLAEEQ